MYKLAVLNTHPIQYFAPLYRRIAQEPDIDLTVYFCSRQGSDEYLDVGFGERLKWDVPLLDGYHHRFLKNLRADKQVSSFWSLINPEIISELRRNRYDALWVNGHNHASYLIAIVAARLLGIPVFMRCETHLGLQRSTFKRALRKPLMRLLYNYFCDVCMPIGTSNKEFYLFHGVDQSRLFTVPYAVDNEYFTLAAQQYAKEDLREELGLPLNKRIILFASKLLNRKRPMDLLVAFHRLQERGIAAALLFVGSGEQELALKDYVRDQRMLDVHFFGFRNQSELPRFYAAADLFVLPSENEPWGLILNEVMCARLPIIASEEIGATADLVHHGKNGFTFASGNIDQLSNYLSRLLESDELRNRMGDESLRIIQQWNYEACVRGVKHALAKVTPASNPLAKEQAA